MCKKELIEEICQKLKKDSCETGGIIGKNEMGDIVKIQFDKKSSGNLYEYHPDTLFLENIINEIWVRESISFVGMVHSHFSNDEISLQDIVYTRKIIQANDSLSSMIIGIMNQSSIYMNIRWYFVDMTSVAETQEIKTI